MSSPNSLIMNLLRIMTPEEIGDIATKHNGGKFLSLTDLVDERVEKKIYRNFTSSDSIDDIHEDYRNAKEVEAKILPFTKPKNDVSEFLDSSSEEESFTSLTEMADEDLIPVSETQTEKQYEHKEDENMSSFILIEKERLKRSQKSLKQKEIIELYQRNSNVDVEQIKSSTDDINNSKEAGVLVNRKHY